VLFQGLFHLAVPDAPFAPFSIAEFVVRQVSGSLATSAIELLGHQALLLVGTLSILSALGLGFVLWRLSPWALALASLLLTLGAALLDPVHPHVLLATVAGLVAGGAALSMPFLLAGRIGGQIPFDAQRRRLLAGAVWGLGAMALAGGTVWRLLRPLSAGSVSADLPLQPMPDPSFDAITGLSPLVTSPQAHYVVDINLDTPLVSEQAWCLFLHGAVGHWSATPSGPVYH
jgi:hypothetical protein